MSIRHHKAHVQKQQKAALKHKKLRKNPRHRRRGNLSSSPCAPVTQQKLYSCDELSVMKKAGLVELARNHDLRGFSKMTKDELISALSLIEK